MAYDIHIHSITDLSALSGQLQSNSGNWDVLREQVRNECTSIMAEASDYVDYAQQRLDEERQRVDDIRHELYALYDELNNADEENQSDIESRIADVENQLSDVEYQVDQIQENLNLLESIKGEIATAASVLNAQLLNFTAKMSDINDKASSALIGYLNGMENIINKTHF